MDPPEFQPKKSASNNDDQKLATDDWKAKYFAKHPAADTNQDGQLSWPEYNSYRAKFDPPPKKQPMDQ